MQKWCWASPAKMVNARIRRLVGYVRTRRFTPVRCCHLVFCCAALLGVVTQGVVAADLRISNRLLEKVAERYGTSARERIQSWRELISTASGKSDLDKLQNVNDFFNRLEYVEDIAHWGKTDYWATPVEFLSTRAGDCEDFSIAKYFTLREMGVPVQRLKITYVKALTQNRAHMVLAYYPTPTADPLVLDNLDKRILSGSKRPDLAPVYSFNGEGLWLAVERGQGKRVGASDRIGLWRDVARRMKSEHAP